MNNQIKIFKNKDFGEIRTVEINSKPYFVGSDIAKALGYAIPSKAINTHCKGVSKMEVPTNGGVQEMLIIPEGDIYRLIVHSKLPKAQEFESWVFDEVLPSIRKNGAYMTENTLEKALSNPDFLIKLATELKEEKEHRQALEEEKKVNAPKVLFAEAVASSKTSILVGDLAKILKQNGHDIGSKRLFEWLRAEGYLIKRKGSDWNMPTQKSMDMQLFEIKESTHLNGDGVNVTTKTPKVTGKGQQYFINKLLHDKSQN